MKKLILALTLSIFAISSAFAQAAFASIDTDRNGGVTMEEAKAAGMLWTEDQFAAADKDQNGMLDEAEFAAAIQ